MRNLHTVFTCDDSSAGKIIYIKDLNFQYQYRLQVIKEDDLYWEARILESWNKISRIWEKHNPPNCMRITKALFIADDKAF